MIRYKIKQIKRDKVGCVIIAGVNAIELKENATNVIMSAASIKPAKII